MSMSRVLNYLASLEQNNNRDWFHANKGEYQEAVGEFELLVGDLVMELRKTNSKLPLVPPKELTFKLQRDTRFSHDKSPYNPAFRAHMGEHGKLPIPVGCYLMIRPGGRSFLGGGLFADMFKDATAMVRDFISVNGDEWEQIITAPPFKECFTVQGTALKRVPQGYDPNHPQAEFLKHKSWFIEFPVSDETVADENFVNYAVEIFSKMEDFHNYLNRALAAFKMPAR